MESLNIANKTFSSRLFTGTGKFGSPEEMYKTIKASESQLVTVALKRVNISGSDDPTLAYLKQLDITLLPNTSGTRNAEEAIFAAQLAQEALGTNWIKLEIHPDPKYLLPDSEETLKAAKELVKQGFIVLPYIQADPVLCKKLEDVGVATVMPLGAPIGSNLGIQTKKMLEIIIQQSQIPVIVDAGIGTPSDATTALEMGADAVLVNTAIATAGNPMKMAVAFKLAVEAGRTAYEAKLAGVSNLANATSPLTEFLS